MPSLLKKVSRGRSYWQIVQSRRVNGKPRPIVLCHLGTAEALLAKLRQAPSKPLKAKVFEFGASAALWNLAQRLDLVSLIDQVVPKRHQGLSCGQYLLLAAMNRCIAPCSKASLYDWYKNCALQRLLPIAKSSLASQRFWDHMAYIKHTHISQIEKLLVAKLIDHFDIDLRTLLFDATNFHTFIDTRTPCLLPQRGRSKSKRSDLRIIGLALMVSTDFNIPLFSYPYPGNRNDSTVFGDVVGSLVEKLVEFSKQCDHITLVFDGGNNSQENIESLDSSNYHFITSLTLSHHADLLEIGVKNFESFSNPRLQGTSAYRTQKQVWGKNRTLVITRSEELYRGQIAGIEQCLQKRRRAMRILRAKLLRSHARKKGKGYTQDSLDKHLKELTSGQYITEILKTRIFKDAKGRLDFRFWTDPNAYRRLQSTRLGKRILCTDNHHWQTEEIILASRAQSHIERAFRQMKNPHWVSFSPTFHWTDQKLRVHVFYCVLALTLVCLLQREASQKGIELSVPELMKELTKIKEVASFYASGKSGKAGALRSEYVLTETNAEQKKLIQAFQIEKLRHP